MFCLKFRSELLQMYFCMASFHRLHFIRFIAMKKIYPLLQLSQTVEIISMEHVSSRRFQGIVSLMRLTETQSRHIV